MSGDTSKDQRPYNVADEAKWLAGLQASHLSAFDAIYVALVPTLYRFAQRFVSADAAEDVVQDVMADLWDRRDAVVVRGTLRGYLFGAVRRRIADLRRREGVAERYAAGILPLEPAPSPERTIEAHELESALHAAMAELSDRARVILQLRWNDGLSYPEIAEALDMSVEAAKKQGRRMELLVRSLLARFAPS